MIAALALLTTTAAFPPSGTYQYSLTLNGQPYITSTVLITPSPKGISVGDAFSIPSKGLTGLATSVFDATTFKPISYSADFNTPGNPEHVEASFKADAAMLTGGGETASVKADAHAPLELLADNFPGTTVGLPAILAANAAYAYTIATLNGTAIVATVMPDVHPTRPKDVPAGDVSLVVDAVNIREIYWYDRKSYVVHELDVPAQNAVLTLTGSSASTAPLVTPTIPPPAKSAFREESVAAPIAGGHLSGTLMLPTGAGPFPVALIIAGSGPVDRNGNEFGALNSDAYKKLANDLAASGIATLRYDKRGIGFSPLRQPESTLRFDDYVHDANVLAALLERDKRFSSVSMIGHSEGSLIGMLAASRDSHVRAFVSLEGAGRDLATVLNEQVRADSADYSANEIAEIERINASLLAGKTVSNTDPKLDPLFRASVQPYLISEYKYDPAHEIAELKIPVLIVHGTTDIQVSLADAKLLAAGDPHAKLVLIPGMNHILVDAPLDRTGNLTTYNQPALPLSAKLVLVIAQFLQTAL